MKRLALLTILGLLATTAWAGPIPTSPAHDADARMSRSMQAMAQAGQPDFVDVIVRFRQKPGKSDDDVIRGLGGEAKRGYEQFPLRAARMPVSALEALSRNPRVAFVSRDAPVQGLAESLRGTANLNENPIDFGYAGWGLGVAVLDSGVGNSVDLWPSPIQYDFVGQPTTPAYGLFDTWGHGTHVSGIIAGDGYDSGGDHRGVAPYADIISLRVLDHEGMGVTSDVIAALDWLLLHAGEYNIRVANLSLGKPIEEPAANDPLVAAVEAVWDAGIVVVCSAGNHGRDGYFTITSPGNSSKVITVGSLTNSGTEQFEDDYVSTYSSRGPTLYDHFVKPDLIAPGNRYIAPVSYEAQMRTDLADRLVDCGHSNCSQSYLELSGTSMAAAMVSGAAAMMLDADPGLNPATVKARLMRSAKKADMGDPFTSGAGLLDIGAALAETGTVTAAPSPRAFRNETTGQMGFESTAVIWGDLSWNQAILWGDALIWGDAVIWGDALVWGDALIWGDAVIWGDHVQDADPLFRTSSQLVELHDD